MDVGSVPGVVQWVSKINLINEAVLVKTFEMKLLMYIKVLEETQQYII